MHLVFNKIIFSFSVYLPIRKTKMPINFNKLFQSWINQN